MNRNRRTETKDKATMTEDKATMTEDNASDTILLSFGGDSLNVRELLKYSYLFLILHNALQLLKSFVNFSFITNCNYIQTI